VFEPLWPTGANEIDVYADHNEIHFYTWSETQCCLPKGSTSATLIDPGSISDAPPPGPGQCGDDTPSQKPPSDSPGYPRSDDYRLHLKPCDVLVFEEVKGPHTGNPADADPARRHTVRLTAVRQSWDPLTRKLVVEIAWASEDALPFPLCISSIGSAPECSLISDVSVARGNVLLVDHGRSVIDELGQVPTRAVVSECGDECLPTEVRNVPGVFRPTLPRPDLTHSEPVPPCVLPPLGCDDEVMRITAASSLLRQGPRTALPWIVLRSIPAAPNGEPAYAASYLDDPTALATAIANAGTDESQPAAWLYGQLTPVVQAALSEWAAQQPLPPLPVALQDQLLQRLQSLEQEWQVRQDLLDSGRVCCCSTVGSSRSDAAKACSPFAEEGMLRNTIHGKEVRGS
jgi:hypothetical protein